MALVAQSVTMTPSFPGGHESEGEDYPIGTALRECKEETGLSVTREGVFGCIGPVPNRVSSI